MLDLSWTELLVIAVTAIIFIGPKELPGTLRMLGKWITKARGLAREFQGGVDDMIRHAEFEDIRKQLQKVESLDVSREIQKAVDPTGTISNLLKEKMPVAVDPETGEPVYGDRALELLKDQRQSDPDTPDIFNEPRKAAPMISVPAASSPAAVVAETPVLPEPAAPVTPPTAPPSTEVAPVGGETASASDQPKNPPTRATAG